MSFVLITVDFPGISSEEMGEVYKRLERSNWKKMHEHSRTTNTIWMTSFAPGVSEGEAIKIAQVSFLASCSPYCRPVIVLQWGSSTPIHSGEE